MTQKSRAAILTEIGTLLADNTTQDISPDDVRTVVQDINDSFMLNTSLTRAALQALMSGVTVEVNSMYTVTNAVGATKVIVVFGKTTSTISTLAMNLTDNTFGVYDIAADTYYSSSVNFKKSLSAANLIADGDYAISECPTLPAGYAWKMTSCDLWFQFVTTPFTTLTITTGVAGLSAAYTSVNGVLDGLGSDLFAPMQYKDIIDGSNIIQESTELSVTVASTGSGDCTAIVYGTARIITL